MYCKTCSASSISTYEMCQFKYYMCYDLGHWFPSYKAEVGTIIHDALEEYAYFIKSNGKLGDKDSYSLVRKAIVEKQPQKGYHKKVTTDEAIAFAFDLLDKVFNRDICPFKTYPIIGIEEPFKLEISDQDYTMSGFIDLIRERDKDTLEILDWKTGTFTKSHDELKDDPQALIYFLAGKVKYPQYNNIILTFEYLTKTPVELTFTEKECEDGIEKIVSIMSAIKDNAAPKKIRKCWKCQYLCSLPTCQKEWKKLYSKGK